MGLADVIAARGDSDLIKPDLIDVAEAVDELQAQAAVYVQTTQPASPDAPALWIPLDANGDPLPPDEWQVFT